MIWLSASSTRTTLVVSPLRANDDETNTCREFTLEILWGVRRG